MIDIHTHILPDVDDGAGDMIDSILMAEMAVESGVHTMIATPHFNLPGEAQEEPDRLRLIASRYVDLVQTLRQRQIPLKLLIGMEIFALEGLDQLIRQSQLISLNNSRHYLIEFGFDENARWCTDRLQEIISTGGIPVIAHPERYTCVQRKPELVSKWRRMGCQIQVNQGSILGNFGKNVGQTSRKLLCNGDVTYVASDAHSPYQRTTYMRDIYEFLCDEFSVETADMLLEKNAEEWLI